LFFISDSLPIAVTLTLFAVILIINLIFFYTWFKLTFSKYYEVIRKYIPCCKNKKPTTRSHDPYKEKDIE